eukprot:10148794-Heterocapsa_arctica.AAC.1
MSPTRSLHRTRHLLDRVAKVRSLLEQPHELSHSSVVEADLVLRERPLIVGLTISLVPPGTGIMPTREWRQQ